MLLLKLIIILTILILIAIILLRCFKKDKFDINNYPIDLVYTWAGENNDINNVRESYNDELKFSLRSVFKYMKWINKIYIVINYPLEKNKPSWFNELYKDKIVLLDQKDIFPEEEHHKLPCKVADIIETYLCNIPNLSEHFIYMNDDFIINTYLSSSDFFTNDNKILLHKSIKDYKKINFNNNLGFSKYPFHHKTRQYHPHIPYAFTKTSYNNFLKKYHEYIGWIRSFTYKKRIDINQCKNYGLRKPCHQLHYFYRIYLYRNNLGIIDNNINQTYLIGNNNLLFMLTRYYFRDYKHFVINEAQPNVRKNIFNFLNKKFPNKLYFEI